MHLYGQMADMDAILAIAKRHGLVVIEDACQAHGAEYKGQRAGSMGLSGCFSFYPGQEPRRLRRRRHRRHQRRRRSAKTIRMLRDWGQEKRYHHVLKGFNYRMDGIQGAVLGVKLPYLEKWTELRRSARARRTVSTCKSAGVGVAAGSRQPPPRVSHLRGPHRPNATACRAHSRRRASPPACTIPSRCTCSRRTLDLGYKAGDFPESERAANEVLSLPMFPEMPTESVRMVADAVRAAALAGTRS